MSTSTSTDPDDQMLRLNQELAAAIKIGARSETIDSLKTRLQQDQEQQTEEDQHRDIGFIKLWSNPFLIRQYKTAVDQADELMANIICFDPVSATGPQPVEVYESTLKVIETIEDEGRSRQIPPFIPEKEAQEHLVKVLAELTGPEGFVSSKRIAEKAGYTQNEVKRIIENLYQFQKVLRYPDGSDSWAISVATRQKLGFSVPKLSNQP